jgi:hypothetical protein
MNGGSGATINRSALPDGAAHRSTISATGRIDLRRRVDHPLPIAVARPAVERYEKRPAAPR